MSEYQQKGGGLAGDMLFYPYGQEWQYDNGVNADWWQFYNSFSRWNPSLGFDITPHRKYSPTLGRWMTPDPGGRKVVDLANPQTWNMYAYVTDNPISLDDPSRLVPPGNTGGGNALSGSSTTSDSCSKNPSAHCLNTNSNGLAAAQQQMKNETVGKTTVGALARTMSNEDRSLSGGEPGELVKGKTALANAIINGAKLPHPPKVAPATGVPTSQDAQIMQGAYTNRVNGGADPVNGRVYYGTTHNPNVQWRPAGNGLPGTAGRETVYQKFGPFKDSISPLSTWIVIYNNPGH